MTYKLEPGLTRITSPIILHLPDQTLQFNSGVDLVEAVFKHRYRVVEIKAIENKIGLSLEGSDEPDQSFF